MIVFVYESVASVLLFAITIPPTRRFWPPLIVLLVPLLPAVSVWNATAEYEPSASAGDAATENAPATHGADNASVVGPVTASATAPSPVEQLPEMVGVMFDDGVVTAFKVTTGAVVSTVKLTALLVPVFAAASVCDATAE